MYSGNLRAHTLLPYTLTIPSCLYPCLYPNNTHYLFLHCTLCILIHDILYCSTHYLHFTLYTISTHTPHTSSTLTPTNILHCIPHILHYIVPVITVYIIYSLQTGCSYTNYSKLQYILTQCTIYSRTLYSSYTHVYMYSC